MSHIGADIFLMSMSILYLAMAAGIIYLLKRKIKQDKQKDKGGEE